MAGPPRPGKKSGTETTLRFRVDEREYVLRPDEINAIDANACRREVGVSVRALMQQAQVDADIDVIAALVWLARRQGGEPSLAFRDVAAALTYDSDIDLIDEVDEGEGHAADSGGTSASSASSTQG